MGLKILIVDDSAFARSFIKRSIMICGIEDAEFREAANGEEAQVLIQSEYIDIIFTDLNMPDMTGDELLKSIKTNPIHSDIPVVVVTSLNNPAREKDLLEHHATAVLDKPISLDKLDLILINDLKIKKGVNL
ncbi:MAG: response regulator [Calditrichaeota bacterium]|nr:response regulator [Calditrichota bacterium]